MVARMERSEIRGRLHGFLSRSRISLRSTRASRAYYVDLTRLDSNIDLISAIKLGVSLSARSLRFNASQHFQIVAAAASNVSFADRCRGRPLQRRRRHPRSARKDGSPPPARFRRQRAKDADEVLKNWHQIKAQERQSKAVRRRVSGETRRRSLHWTEFPRTASDPRRSAANEKGRAHRL